MAISLVGTASTDASSGTAVSLTHGLTIQSGDVVIATVNANGAGNTITDNNGSYPFTADHYTENPESARFAVFSRRAGSSEPSSYAFTLGSSDRWSIVVRVYRGCNSHDIWDVAPSASTVATGEDSNPAVASAITIATSGACGLVLMGHDYTPPHPTFSSINNSYGNVKSEEGQQFQVTADKLGLSTGSTGTTSVTASGNMWWVVYQVALKPPVTYEMTLTKESVSAVTISPKQRHEMTLTLESVSAVGITGVLLLSPPRYDMTAALDSSLWQVMAGNNTQGWRDITGEISGLTYSHVRPGGAASCSFTISADVDGLGYNELQPDQLVAVRYDGELVWDGYILPRGTNYQGA